MDFYPSAFPDPELAHDRNYVLMDGFSMFIESTQRVVYFALDKYFQPNGQRLPANTPMPVIYFTEKDLTRFIFELRRILLSLEQLPEASVAPPPAQVPPQFQPPTTPKASTPQVSFPTQPQQASPTILPATPPSETPNVSIPKRPTTQFQPCMPFPAFFDPFSPHIPVVPPIQEEPAPQQELPSQPPVSQDHPPIVHDYPENWPQAPLESSQHDEPPQNSSFDSDFHW
jgi:hypothetical protein